MSGAKVSVREELSEMQIGEYNKECKIDYLLVNKYSGDEGRAHFMNAYFNEYKDFRISYDRNYSEESKDPLGKQYEMLYPMTVMETYLRYLDFFNKI